MYFEFYDHLGIFSLNAFYHTISFIIVSYYFVLTK